MANENIIDELYNQMLEKQSIGTPQSSKVSIDEIYANMLSSESVPVQPTGGEKKVLGSSPLGQLVLKQLGVQQEQQPTEVIEPSISQKPQKNVEITSPEISNPFQRRLAEIKAEEEQLSNLYLENPSEEISSKLSELTQKEKAINELYHKYIGATQEKISALEEAGKAEAQKIGASGIAKGLKALSSGATFGVSDIAHSALEKAYQTQDVMTPQGAAEAIASQLLTLAGGVATGAGVVAPMIQKQIAKTGLSVLGKNIVSRLAPQAIHAGVKSISSVFAGNRSPQEASMDLAQNLGAIALNMVVSMGIPHNDTIMKAINITSQLASDVAFDIITESMRGNIRGINAEDIKNYFVYGGGIANLTGSVLGATTDLLSNWGDIEKTKQKIKQQMVKTIKADIKPQKIEGTVVPQIIDTGINIEQAKAEIKTTGKINTPEQVAVIPEITKEMTQGEVKALARNNGIDDSGLKNKVVSRIEEEIVTSPEFLKNAPPISESKADNIDLNLLKTVLPATVGETGMKRQSPILSRLKEADSTPQEVKERIGKEIPDIYTQQETAKVMEWATREIDTNPDKAIKLVRSDVSTPEITALSIAMLRKARQAKNVELESEIIDILAKKARANGRSSNLIKQLYDSESPEAFISRFIKDVKEAGGSIDIKQSKADIAEIQGLYEQIQKMGDTPERWKLQQQLWDKMSKFVHPTLWERMANYRYNNVLFNYKSPIRNLWTGLLNVFVTGAPKQILRYGKFTPMEALRWYSDVVRAFPAAMDAFKKSWKEAPYRAASGTENDVTSISFNINAAKESQIGIWHKLYRYLLTPVDDMMKTLNQTALQESFKRMGVNPEIIAKASDTLSDIVLYKHKLGDADLQSVLNPLAKIWDGLGAALQYVIKQSNMTGRMTNILQMFVGVPFNFARNAFMAWGDWQLPFISKPLSKLALQVGKYSGKGVKGFVAQASHDILKSMADFLGNPRIEKLKAIINNPEIEPIRRQQAQNQLDYIEALRGEVRARTFIASLAMLWGAYKAMQGDIVVAISKDPENKKKELASGRRPGVIKMQSGDKEYFVSLWYLGEYALPLYLMGALYHNMRNNPETVDNNVIKNISWALLQSMRFLASQSSAKGFDNMLAIMAGARDIEELQQDISYQSTQFIPYSAMIKQINDIFDPVKRRSKNFTEGVLRMVSSLMPLLGHEIDPYLTPENLPAERSFGEIYLPYPILEWDKKYDAELQLILANDMIMTRERKAFLRFVDNRPPEEDVRKYLYQRVSDGYMTKEQAVALWRSLQTKRPDLYKNKLFGTSRLQLSTGASWKKR